VDVIGLLMAGWASNNKYSLLGSFRSVAQIISYEVPVGLSVLTACAVCQSLDLQEISYQQGILSPEPVYFLGVKGWDVSGIGGFLAWNVFRMPLLFLVWVIYFIATLAESNRAPFDLPEAESELVAGFQSEYSGTRFLIIMLGEYSMMLLVSFVGVILFWGSWNTALPQVGSLPLATWTTGNVWGIFWIISKTLVLVGVQIWVRWAYPRVRIDQLMTISWKYLTPAALLLLLFCAFWKLLLW
jgi:NADH-quinone oxidoreductase subunit H